MICNFLSIGNTRYLVMSLVFCLYSLNSCDKQAATLDKSVKYEIEKKYERGPLTLMVKVDKKEITIAERLQFVLEATSPEEYTVEFPKFGEKLEEFGIVNFTSEPLRLVDGSKTSLRKSYELEPFLSGDYKIPAMKFSFYSKDSPGKKHELDTEVLEIKVKSLLPEKVAELEIKEIAAPEELPLTHNFWLYGLSGILALIVAGVAGFFYLHHRRYKTREKARIAAHELAFQKLEQLLAEQLIEKGLLKEFYARISDILRYYIENRFGLKAPERTTEEFLADIRGGNSIQLVYRNILEEFLTHCDLVKFAEHQPTHEEIQKTFDACKNFILATQIAKAQVEIPKEQLETREGGI